MTLLPVTPEPPITVLSRGNVLSRGVRAVRTVVNRQRVFLGAELLALAIWTLWFASPYLTLDPTVMPTGGEFLAAIQIHQIWAQVRECGSCFMWYGSVAGGYPGLVDPNGSAMHPLVILATLGWGVMNGSKVALVGAFLMAGVAQWWLGRVLGLGRAARLWSAAMAVAGGYLAARMQLGALPLIVSTAACMLVLPPLITLSRTARRRDAVVLGVTLAMAVVAGNGYLQVALAWALPATLVLIPWEQGRASLFVRRYALAVALGLLLAAPFLVPFIHFLPEFAKDTDPTFRSAQPLGYLPLNLVISDLRFYDSDMLGKLPYISHYANFIGWLPVLLAFWALRGGRHREERRAIAFLAAFALLALLVASAIPLELLARIITVPALAQLISGVRYTAFMAALAVPPILALAGIGLDQLLNMRHGRVLLSARPSETTTSFSVRLDFRWLLAIPLGLALMNVWGFSRQFIAVAPLSPEVESVIQALQTPDLQWVNVPFGENFFVTPAVVRHAKLAVNFYLTWHWRDRPPPEPILEANRIGPPPGMVGTTTVDGVGIFASAPGREYAAVELDDGSRAVCTAQGIGGNIDVDCTTTRPGILTVKENNWSGWNARIDGRQVALQPTRWLTLDLPAGRHTISFRYRPWDVPLGLLVSLFGLALAVSQWRRDEQ